MTLEDRPSDLPSSAQSAPQGCREIDSKGQTPARRTGDDPRQSANLGLRNYSC